MKKIFLFISLITSGIAVGQSVGPSTLNTCGGSSNIAGDTFEWSVGEMTAVHTASSADITVTHGILQPKNRGNGVDVDEVFFSENQISVYPNPTEGLVFIQLHLSAGTQLSYTLVDFKGKIILQENTNLAKGDDIVPINLESYSGGAYMLNIEAKTLSENYFETFKIVKK